MSDKTTEPIKNLLDGDIVEQKYFVYCWHPDSDEVEGGHWYQDDDIDPQGSFEQANLIASSLLNIYPTRRFSVVRRSVVEKEIQTYQTSRSRY